MDTETEIRQREQSAGTSETPALAGGDGGDDDGGAGLPLPSLSKKHLAIIGAVVAVAVVVWWMRRDSDDGGENGGLDVARSEVDGTTQATIEDEEDDGEIHVEHDPKNPLAADASVIKEFRARGILSPGDD